MSEIIKLENVIKMYSNGIRAINDVSLSICDNESVVFYGAPGSGKRTLMRLIAAMEAPSAGRVFVMDKAVYKMDVNAASDFRNQNIGVVQRESGLMERLSVLDNIALPLALQRISYSKRKQQAKEQLEALGIGNVAHAYPPQLSKYEAKKTSIARALIVQPKILMLYEITAGLSAKETEEIIGIVNALAKYGSYTIISFVSVKEKMLYANKRIELNHGKIQEDKS